MRLGKCWQLPQVSELGGDRREEAQHRATCRSLQWYPALDLLSRWIANDRWGGGEPFAGAPDWELALNKNEIKCLTPWIVNKF